MKLENTKRFSNRVEDYVKYRPGYPPAIVSYLREEYGFTNDKRIADIGAGTGISAELFLKAGYKVTAVEPNKEMREKSLELLRSYSGFQAVNGTAEQTTLPDYAADVIVAGQAFHWFDQRKSREEFKRVLQQDGLVVLIWNERKIASSFEKDYEKLIVRHGRDYVQVDHRNIDEEHISAFFYPEPFHLEVFVNQQVFDFEGLLGRLLSSSYMPTRMEEGYNDMYSDLEELFGKYQENGSVVISYDTKVYIGRL